MPRFSNAGFEHAPVIGIKFWAKIYQKKKMIL